jgi:hypothetical protein
MKKLLLPTLCLSLVVLSGCSTPVEVAEGVRTTVELEDEPGDYDLLRIRGKPEGAHLLMSGAYGRTANDLLWMMGPSDIPLIVRAKIHEDRIEITIPRHPSLIPALCAVGKSSELKVIDRSALRRMDTHHGLTNGIIDDSSPWLTLDELAKADHHWE